jgi:hypothetical protein
MQINSTLGPKSANVPVLFRSPMATSRRRIKTMPKGLDRKQKTKIGEKSWFSKDRLLLIVDGLFPVGFRHGYSGFCKNFAGIDVKI